MGKELEELWSRYQTAKPFACDEEKQKIADRVIALQTELCTDMSEKQMMLFEEFEFALNEMNSIGEKNAFICGVRFATRYLIEAMGDD